MKVINQSISRFDTVAKVNGSALYPGDYNLPGQLYMKVLFALRPHAIVRAIETTEAEKVSGVVAVLTAKDVPVNEYGLGVSDQPVLCGPGSTKQFADRVRFVGDQVAVIIAETEEIASQARNLIRVDYEDLPVITNQIDALKPGAVLLHPDLGTNEFCHFQIDRGNVEQAFTDCDVIIEGTYITPVQEHAYLQPEAGIAYIDGEQRITVIVSGQWTHEDQEQIAHSLNLPKEKVRVIYPAIGGAFGGREDMSVQIILALAVMRLHEQGIDRPIKITWSREESIIGHHKRHQYLMRAKWGANREGKILAVDVQILADGGAYVYTSPKVLGNATLLASGPYEVPNVRVDAKAIYTNNIPGGAFRGFGGPQAAFQAEMQVNKLAEVLHMDPVEIRMRNLYQEGSMMPTGTPIPDVVSIREVLADCAQKAGWVHDDNGWHKPDLKQEKCEKVSGLGIACGYKNIGFSFGYQENCHARIMLMGETEIEKAILWHAGADVGQGAHSAFAQFAAEALDIPVDKISVIASDTATSGNSGSASASRLTFMSGNSIIGAAKVALEKWHKEERPAVGEFTYLAPKTTPFTPVTGEGKPNFTYGYVAEAISCEVDRETGLVSIDQVICANDVGMAVNPMQVEGQIEGAVVQAAGYTNLENFITKDGYPQTKLLSTYLIPTVLDIPNKVHSLIHEHADSLGPYGARGMGEMPYLPYAPAVCDAVHAATGVWFDDFPLTPERVLRGMGKI